MNAKNLYRNLAKEVHPDFNGGGAEFTRKMQEVNRFKDNPEMLLKLARQWGLNIDGTFDQDRFDRKSQEFRDKVFEAVVGAVVRHTFYKGRKYYNVRGVIIKIRDITKGKLVGGREFSIYDFITERIWNVKTLNETPFTVVGMADNMDVEKGIQRLAHVKETEKNHKKALKDVADTQFQAHNLMQDFNYEEAGIEYNVQFKLYGACRVGKIVRTTVKSLYVKIGGYEKLYRVNIGNVYKVTKIV